MKTLHVVSHTHWDREWYRTFQDFRFRLVRLIDRLLDLLEQEPDYRFFTLDGQTIVLDDYLAIRPEQEPRIRRLIEAGRLLVGPWYTLPDEFLEGPEPMVRNLLFGREGCRRYSSEPQPMETIAYVPDSFGHVGQIPQIAAGFGMAAACVWRGVGASPTEFRWASPDGTECLMLHLRESYSSGAWLAVDPDGFVRDLGEARDLLAPHAPTRNLLIMNGTDHMEPRADLPACLRTAQERLGDCVLHSTLPDYLVAVQQELGPDGLAALPRIQGELRSPERAHLLPAVLSSRLWIKQSNARCENLLTRWAEPFSALAEQVTGLAPHRGFLHEAWRWLLQNHPHDSICGCSIDEVHDEMRTRFAWSEQIAEQVTQASLSSIAKSIEKPPSGTAAQAPVRICVFNPTTGLRTDCVRAHFPAAPQGEWQVVDDAGRPVPQRLPQPDAHEFYNERMTRKQFAEFMTRIAAAQGSQLGHLRFSRAETGVQDGVGFLHIVVIPGESEAEPVLDFGELALRIQALLADESISCFHLHVAEETGQDVEFVARDIPSLGYRQFSVVPGSWQPSAYQLAQTGSPSAYSGCSIENEFFRAEADPSTGTLTITDKATGRRLAGLNRFVDGGDRGDEYNFCAPQHDVVVDGPSLPPEVCCTTDGVGQTLEVALLYRIPHSLAEADRSRRGSELVDMPITSRISLLSGVRRIDFETSVINQGRDHRLRVLFPTPFATDKSWAEGHFDVVQRPTGSSAGTDGWPEQPVGTYPQLTFVDVTGGQEGLLLANQGLPEYELLPAAEGEPGPTLALTLLRCTGWLSRGDLPNRAGPAGPALETPGAQCLGQYTLRYALVPHTGNYLGAQREAHAFNAPLRAVCWPSTATDPALSPDEAPLPAAGSFVTLSPAALVLTAVKPPEDGEGLILRAYNSAPIPVLARLKFWRAFRELAQVRMDEAAVISRLAQDADVATFSLRAKEIVTLRVSFQATSAASRA